MKELKNINLYTDEGTPLLKHFSEYDNVFVGLLPFFKLDKENCDTKNSKRIISLEEAQEKYKIFNNIENHSNMTIYAPNDCYPTNEEIKQNGKAINWKEIIENTEIKDIRQLNKALMTAIGALKKQSQRQDLQEILNQYTSKNNIWYPTEGTFDYFTKKSIFNALKSANINEIEIEDEFYEHKKELELNGLTESEFCDKIEFKDYYIYPKDKSILFSIGWDYFFFFIAVKQNVFSKQEIEKYFEGFWATENDSDLWAWGEGEVEQLPPRYP